MSDLFLKIVNMSISASWLVLAVLLLRIVFKKAPKWANVLLWGIVAVRLICPFSIESALSLIPSAETIPLNIELDTTPAINSGIPVINAVVNPAISQSNTPANGASINPLQITVGIFENIWILGVAALLFYTAISYWRLRRKVSEATVLRDNIYQSENVASPFVLGMIKPRIYLPYGMNEQNLRHVVAHEQAHIRRRDHWWKPLGFLLLTIHWFNPLMWLAYILLCRDIELACDEKVIKELGSEQRADYTQALVACSVNRRMIAACPLAFGEVGVKERVKSVMNYKKPAFWIIVLSVIACVVVAVCFLTDPSTPEKEPNYLNTSSLYIGTEQEVVNLTARLELVDLLQTYEKTSFQTGLDDPNDTSISVEISFSDGSSCLLHYYFYDGLSWKKLTSGEGYYRSVLTYWDAEGETSAWEFHENFNYKFMAWYNKWKTPEPVLEQASFSDILGCSGYVLSDNTMEFWSIRDYYAVIGNQQFLIAQTFGFGEAQDYVRDLDGDGVTELIANVQFNGDGGAMVYVYQRRGNTIYQGTLFLSDLPNHDDWGANSTYSEYDPKTGVFYFYYAQVGSEEYAVLTTTSLSDFDFVEYCVLPGEESGNEIINIIDPTKDEEFSYPEAVEKFFEDENNEYFFSGIYSQYVIVYYADGTQEDIVTALNSGRATISDLDRFDIRYRAESKPIDLSSVIISAILDHFKSSDPDGLYHCASFVLLEQVELCFDSDPPVPNQIIVYGMALHEKFGFAGETIREVGNQYAVPVKLTFERTENGGVRLLDAWFPEHPYNSWDEYSKAVYEQFVTHSDDLATSTLYAILDDLYRVQLKQECYQQAVAYIDIDTTPILEDLFAVIESSPLYSSNPGSYIDAHPNEYKELLYYGDITLQYIFSKFLEGDQIGLRGHIMRALLDDLAPEAQLRLYAMTGQEYFDEWKAAAIRLSEQHEMEWIKENQPAMYLLLQMIEE